MGWGEEERLPSLGASGEVTEDRIRIGKSAGGMNDYFPHFGDGCPMRLLGRPKQNKSPWWRKIIAGTSDSLNDSIPHNVFFLLWSLLSHRGVVSAPLLQSTVRIAPKHASRHLQSKIRFSKKIDGARFLENSVKFVKIC
jgi:hypothetical protein